MPTESELLEAIEKAKAYWHGFGFFGDRGENRNTSECWFELIQVDLTNARMRFAWNDRHECWDCEYRKTIHPGFEFKPRPSKVIRTKTTVSLPFKPL